MEDSGLRDGFGRVEFGVHHQNLLAGRLRDASDTVAHLLVRFRLLVHLHLEARGPPEQVRHAARQVVGSLDRPHLERADKKKNLRFELGMLDLGLIDQLLIDLNDLVSSIGQ